MGCTGFHTGGRGYRTAATFRAIVLALCLALSTTSYVAAQSVDEQVITLNQEAMDAYNMLEVDRAAELLEQALQLAAGSPEALKRTYMNLAIVHIDGLQNNGPGGEYLKAALCMDPTLQLDPLTSTPNIQAAFAWATEEVNNGACGQQPATTATPPPTQQTAGPGQLGDECASDADCGSGLLCREFYCMAGGDGPPGEPEEPEPSKRAGKAFANLGFAVGMSYLSEGMPADSEPPQNILLNGREFNTESPWVPDADSADIIGPLGGGCPADGTVTGLDPMTGAIQNPSSYCVNLAGDGFTAGYALRLGIGYFFTDDLSGSLVIRFQPDSGEGTLSSVLIGARGEYWLGPLGGTPLEGSVFGGLTFGQIQAQPGADYEDGPYAMSGPAGAHVGMGLRYPFNDQWAYYAAPEIVFQFPDAMFHIDLTIAGIEATF